MHKAFIKKAYRQLQGLNKITLRRLFIFIFTFTVTFTVTAIQVHAQTIAPGTAVDNFLSPVSEDFFHLKKEEPMVVLAAHDDSSPDECQISDVFPPQIQKWEGDICRWSKEHNMDPDLIATVMQIESCGNQNAVSFTGVRGLFQVTGANLDGGDPFDPNVSMAKGPGKVLKTELRLADGDIRAAMAGYNGGGKARDYIHGKINRDQFYWFLVNHGSGLWRTRSKALAKINEVERYAQWANIYFESKEGKTDTMRIWWDLGGGRMCDQSIASNGR